MREPTEDVFLRDVATHEMQVLLEGGLYRHLRFRNPASGYLWFDLVTWPHALTIFGDMGTWTFSRVEDMFTFFRSHDGKLRINVSYWAEKLQNGIGASRDHSRQFDPEVFADRLLMQLKDYYCFEGEDLAQLTEAVKEQVLALSSNEWEMFNAVQGFRHRFKDGRSFEFNLYELPDGKEYVYQFIWCLYAIAWGIQQWDARRRENEPSTARDASPASATPPQTEDSGEAASKERSAKPEPQLGDNPDTNPTEDGR